MDATLAWTVVGSAAGVAGVAVAVVAVTVQVRSGQSTSSKVTAELAAGQIDQFGVLHVEFASGKIDVIALPKPGKARTIEKGGSGERGQGNLEFSPVNVIFVRNQGRLPVTVSRCRYISDLGLTDYIFEPLPAASKRGDHLPVRLNPGEGAVLVHDFVTIKQLLNRVLRDYESGGAVFEVVLTLGDGKEVTASPSMLFMTDMREQELTAPGPELVRPSFIPQHRYIASQFMFVRRKISGPRRWLTRNR